MLSIVLNVMKDLLIIILMEDAKYVIVDVWNVKLEEIRVNMSIVINVCKGIVLILVSYHLSAHLPMLQDIYRIIIIKKIQILELL